MPFSKLCFFLCSYVKIIDLNYTITTTTIILLPNLLHCISYLVTEALSKCNHILCTVTNFRGGGGEKDQNKESHLLSVPLWTLSTFLFNAHSSHYLMDQWWQRFLFHNKRFGAYSPPIHGGHVTAKKSHYSSGKRVEVRLTHPCESDKFAAGTRNTTAHSVCD